MPTSKALKKYRGYYETKLNEILEEIGVVRQYYHSMSFIGNHCEKLLKNSSKLCANLKKISAFEYEKYFTIFHKFYLCFQLYSKNEFLTPQEIRHLELRCTSYGSYWNKHFPSETCPPKHHLLVTHIPEFAQEFHSVGTAIPS